MVDGREVVIKYASRALKGAEKHYPPTLLEAAAVVYGVRHFDRFLADKPFKIFTDHKCLKHLFACKNPSNHKMLRWAMELQQYQFEVIYKPGKQHRNVDYISRLPVQEEKVNQVGSTNS